VRFSQNFLISDEPDGHRWLTFRLVRISPHPLRDCALGVMCGVAAVDGDGVMRCSEKMLKIQTSQKNFLETWFVRHKIDETSPLHQSRFTKLAFLNVTLRVFDTAYMEEARIFHSYVPCTDMVRNARFETMKSWTVVSNDADNSEVTIRELRHHVDFSKLDCFARFDRTKHSSKHVFLAAVRANSVANGSEGEIHLANSSSHTAGRSDVKLAGGGAQQLRSPVSIDTGKSEEEKAQTRARLRTSVREGEVKSVEADEGALAAVCIAPSDVLSHDTANSTTANETATAQATVTFAAEVAAA